MWPKLRGKLHGIDFSDNGFPPESTLELWRILSPQLQELRVAKQPLKGHGKVLAEVLKKSKTLRCIDISFTQLDPADMMEIREMLRESMKHANDDLAPMMEFAFEEPGQGIPTMLGLALALRAFPDLKRISMSRHMKAQSRADCKDFLQLPLTFSLRKDARDVSRFLIRTLLGEAAKGEEGEKLPEDLWKQEQDARRALFEVCAETTIDSKRAQEYLNMMIGPGGDLGLKPEPVKKRKFLKSQLRDGTNYGETEITYEA